MKKIPSLSLSNGLDFPIVPECLKILTRLEERLCSPRIPFMQIRNLGIDHQKGLKGQIVNVPISVDTTVTELPRAVSDSHIILLKIKRKMSYQHDYMSEIVNVSRVLNALKFLINTPLYKELNLKIANEWKQFENCERNMVKRITLNDNDEIDEHFIDHESNAVDYINSESDLLLEDLTAGCTETLLTNSQISSITMAPGEGQIPLSLLFDENAEELAFPTIHCGQKRIFKVKLTFKQKTKSALKHFNRNCCRVDKLFFLYKKNELISLSNNISICLRKKKI